MRTLKTALFLLLLFVPLDVRATPVEQDLLAAIRKLALEYLDAQMQSDAGRMDSLLDDHFQMAVSTPNGFRFVTKAESLAALKRAPKIGPRIMTPEATVVEVAGNGALVKATTRDRMELMTILLIGSYRKVIFSLAQIREAEFR